MLKIDLVQQLGSVAVFALDGRLDGTGPEKLKETISGYLRKTPKLVIDCSRLTYIDSRGLGALLSCLRKAMAVDGDLCLTAVQRQVQTLFELVRADKIFEIYRDMDEALASYQPSAQGD